MEDRLKAEAMANTAESMQALHKVNNDNDAEIERLRWVNKNLNKQVALMREHAFNQSALLGTQVCQIVRLRQILCIVVISLLASTAGLLGMAAKLWG